MKSGRDSKQAKDPPVIAINRVIQKFLPKVSAAVKYVLNDFIWTPRPLIEIFSPEIYVAHYLNYLTIDDIRISGRTLVVISEVDLPLTVMLDAALVSFGSILPIVVVAAWWPIYWSIPETVLPYLARVPPDKRQKAQLTLAYEPGVCSLSILDPQSLVDVSLQPCGAPLAGLHTLPWSPPPCQQQRQWPYSTSSPMAAIPQEPSVAPNTRSDAPVWRGLLHLTQSSILRISRKILWATRGSSSFPCSPHQVVSIFLGFYMDFLRANRLLTWRTSARGMERRRRAEVRAAQRQEEEEASYLCYQSGAVFTGNVMSGAYDLYIRARPSLLSPTRPKARMAGGRRLPDLSSRRHILHHRRSDTLCLGPGLASSSVMPSFLQPRSPGQALLVWKQRPQAALVHLRHLVVLRHWLPPREGVG